MHLVIVASVLHGPIGWLIGAVLGLFLVSSFFAHKSDKVQDFIKDRKLPSFVTKQILTENKISEVIEEGRHITCKEVKKEVEKQLTPSASAMTDRILEEIKKLYMSDVVSSSEFADHHDSD
ncbi:MAG: hypothetical protein OEZ31_06845 [Nitrospirota bacterium]|nr:hypothetical protein [Nitrospirota bacterium]